MGYPLILRHPGVLMQQSAALYEPNAVRFDGTNDWLSDTDGLAGLTAAKVVLLAVHLIPRLDEQNTFFFHHTNDFGSTRLQIKWNTLTDFRSLQVLGDNASGTQIVEIDVNDANFQPDTTFNILFAFDLADAANRDCWINDAQKTLTVTTYTNDSIKLDDTDTTLFARSNGDDKSQADAADFFLHFGGTYLDISQEANRRLFFTSAGCLAWKGDNGELPLGVTPSFYHSGATGAWHTNLGTAGGMTLNGALETAPDQPCGGPL